MRNNAQEWNPKHILQESPNLEIISVHALLCCQLQGNDRARRREAENLIQGIRGLPDSYADENKLTNSFFPILYWSSV